MFKVKSTSHYIRKTQSEPGDLYYLTQFEAKKKINWTYALYFK